MRSFPIGFSPEPFLVEITNKVVIMADATGSPNKKLLQLIKEGGKGLLYPEMKYFSKKAESTPGQEQTTPENLGVHALKTLSRMRRSLDNLWGNIFLKLDRDDRHLLFTGCSRRDGTSFIVFHLAMYLALDHHLKVLYVDTDVESGTRDEVIYYPAGNQGLASYFMGEAKLPDLVLDTNIEGFKIMPSGAGLSRNAPSSHIITRQDLLDDLFAFNRSNFDMVIYDAKPVTLSPLSMCFAKLANQVFMVCRYASTRREVCMQGVDKFRQNNVDVSGMLLNDRQFPIPKMIYDLLR
jgi:tyrosine-protein kinase Etk/Wzc